MDVSRRSLLRRLALGGVFGVAGCVGAPGDGTETGSPPATPGESTEGTAPESTPATASPTPVAADDFPTQPLYVVNRTDEDACVQLSVFESIVGPKEVLDQEFHVPAGDGVVFTDLAEIGVKYSLDCTLSDGRELSESWLVKSCGGIGGGANRAGKISFDGDSLYFSESACDVSDPEIRDRTFRENPEGEDC